MKKITFFILTAIICLSSSIAFGQTESLNGTWTNGSVGSIQYQNRTTGSTRSGHGSHFSYKLFANGTYEYVGYMETTMYNCTNTLFNQVTGKFRVGDSKIELEQSRDFWKTTNSCAASGNKQSTKPASKKTVSFNIKQDEYGSTLLCLTEKEAESCFKKEKQ